MSRALCLLGASLCSATLSAMPLHGEVFLDRDGNGRRGPEEPGLAQVKVSNGRQVVSTDHHGRYRIEVQDGDTVFVIKPAGLRMPVTANGLPQTWQHHAPQGSGTTLRYGGLPASRADGRFALLPGAEPVSDAPTKVLVLADSQPKSARDVDYFARDIVAPLRDRHDAVLGITLGDVVNDDLDLLPAMIAHIGELSLPWLHVAGNHDIDFDASDDRGSLDTFRRHFGSDTLAWEESNLVFIGLDDVIYQPGQRPAYVGGLREDQFEFLHNYLAGLDRRRLLVIGLHIPLFEAWPGRETFRAADRQRLFQLLQPFPHVLILSGHSHTQRHVYHQAADGWAGANPLHEYNVGAACGGYWSGRFDAEGIPDSRMADGTPNGFAELEVDNEANYSLRWKVARAMDDPTMSLHAPQVLRRGAWPGAGLYVNVFMGDAETPVQARIDEGEWRSMIRVMERDRHLLSENLQDDLAASLRGYDRLPEAEPSTHLWRLSLPTDLEPGEHRIEVRTIDRWRGELRAETRYRLQELP